MQNLTLFIPGLLGPDIHYSDDFAPKLESLETLLARSGHQQNLSPSYYRSLCELMGLILDPGRDVPVAAITRMIDGSGNPDGIWMRADPVHLRPDHDGLILMDSFVLRLSQHDAITAAAEVNKVLTIHDWVVEVPYEDRWYIRLNKSPEFVTVELPDVVSRNIKTYLPQGGDGVRLHSLINEIQMQLHAAEINDLRESRGELAVNSVWFWGAGRMPGNYTSNMDAVFSDEVFARGLAMKADIPCHPVPTGIDTIIQACADMENVLLVLQHCQAPAQYQNLRLWHEALILLEEAWFAPVHEQLNTRHIRNLSIVTGIHRFDTNWFGLKKVWRKPVPIANYREN